MFLKIECGVAHGSRSCSEISVVGNVKRQHFSTNRREKHKRRLKTFSHLSWLSLKRVSAVWVQQFKIQASDVCHGVSLFSSNKQKEPADSKKHRGAPRWGGSPCTPLTESSGPMNKDINTKHKRNVDEFNHNIDPKTETSVGKRTCLNQLWISVLDSALMSALISVSKIPLNNLWPLYCNKIKNTVFDGEPSIESTAWELTTAVKVPSN